MNKIRLISLFSGYDSQALAMERLKRNFPDFDYELVAWCEIDEMAIHAHNALFPQWADRNVGDICKVNPEELPDCDVITWSFPCQDISLAGKQKGLQQDSGSRSSLAWECMKIFRAKKPKFLLMENVKALTQKKFMPDFMRLQEELEDMGYTNFWQVLNAKDYGVPQNRERVFMVSILGDNAAFEFPKPFPLEKRLRDVLEDNVDESYYLKDEQVAKILEHSERKQAQGCGFKYNFQDMDGIAGTILTAYGNRYTDTYLKTEPEIIQVGNYMDDTGRGFKNPQCGRVYSVEGISPTINTCGGGDREPKILIVGSYSPTSACNGKVLDANGICPTLLDHKGAEPAGIEVVSCAIRGRNPGNPSDRRAGMPTEQRLELGGDVANCLTSVQKDSMVAETCILGYTRDSKGNIQNYHERDIAGTIHTSTGSGGNTDQFVKEVIVQNAHGYNKGGLFEDISPTVTSSAFQYNNFVIKKYRIRRLTERECFRLMGMDDADIDKIDAYRIRKTLKNGKVKEKPIPKSQKYKLAGNSIVVSCLYHIFKGMFIDEKPPLPPRQLNLFDDLWHEN